MENNYAELHSLFRDLMNELSKALEGELKFEDLIMTNSFNYEHPTN